MWNILQFNDQNRLAHFETAILIQIETGENLITHVFENLQYGKTADMNKEWKAIKRQLKAAVQSYLEKNETILTFLNKK